MTYCPCTALFTSPDCEKHWPGYKASIDRSKTTQYPAVSRRDILVLSARFQTTRGVAPTFLNITEEDFRSLVTPDMLTHDAKEYPDGTRMYLELEVSLIPSGMPWVSVRAKQ